MIDKHAQTVWLAALLGGVLAGICGLIFPIAGIGLLVLATLLTLLASSRGPRLVALGGVWLGFGGLWSALLLRAGLECATQPPSSDGCGSSMFQAYVAVGVVTAALGLFVSIRALRRRRQPGIR